LPDASLATVGQIIWRLIEHHGLDPAPFFAEAGIDAQVIRNPHARVDQSRGQRLLHAVAEKLTDPAFGLGAGHCWHPSNLGALGYAWLASSTLRSALGRLARYWRIVNTRVDAALNEVPDGLELVHRPPPADDIVERVRGDIVLAIVLAMCETNFGRPLKPRRVAFRHGAPSDVRPYAALFGCPITFGDDANRFVLGRAEADLPLPTSNRQLAAVHDRILVETLARLDKRDVMTRARASLLERLTSGVLSEQDLAGDLHMSRRSLQRRLAEADATYQSLLDDTRRDLALRHIEDPAKSITDIAFLLGYSQQSAFTRAFRRWTGASPSDYRARSLQSTA
jgi:AraC-like DNA-binding protein